MNIKKCLACGVEKDMDIKEVYTCEGLQCSTTPTDPLFEIDCQPYNFGGDDWRRVIVCHVCWNKLEVDLWISRECWDRIKAITPFDQLPKLE